jgi:hypothetical protein
MRVPAHIIAASPSAGLLQRDYASSFPGGGTIDAHFAVAANPNDEETIPLTRLRQSFAARQFATYGGPQEIVGLVFRPNREGATGDMPEARQIRLSTRTAQVESSPHTVYREDSTAAGSPYPGHLLRFERPFRYDPADGDLLLDIVGASAAPELPGAQTVPAHQLPLAVFVCRNVA